MEEKVPKMTENLSNPDAIEMLSNPEADTNSLVVSAKELYKRGMKIERIEDLLLISKSEFT